jgi:acyl-CoA synthetase (AMP-forming)/AMP-acid ligase II
MFAPDGPGILGAAAKRFPGREAAVSGRERVTYAGLHERVGRVAAGLHRLGPQPGSSVAVLADNSLAYLELYFAVPAAGLLLLPLNTRLAEPEISAILTEAGTGLLLVGPGYEHIAAEVARSCPVRLIALPGTDSGLSAITYERLLDSVPATPAPAPPDQGAYLYYTSGTSGRAKGVVLTHGNVLANALSTAAAVGLTDQDVWLHAGPLFHLADAWAVWAVTWLGGRHVLERFGPERTVATITRERVTRTLLVPTALDLLIEAAAAAGTRLPSLTGLLYGGAPTSPRVFEKARANIDAPLVHTYGATETAGTLTVLPAADHLDSDGNLRTGAVGRETPLVDIEVADSGGGPVGPGTIGQVTVRGPMVARGYLGQDERTRAAFREGRYWTGDLGYRDEGGILWLVGRQSDMIITGGENVYASEVERVLLRMDQIADAAVIGVPDAKWTERVTAFVVLADGARLTLAELREFSRQYLGGYKLPRALHVLPELPWSGAGKVDRSALRQIPAGITKDITKEENGS